MQRGELLDLAVSVAAAGGLGRDVLCEKVTFGLRSLRPGVAGHGKIDPLVLGRGAYLRMKTNSGYRRRQTWEQTESTGRMPVQQEGQAGLLNSREDAQGQTCLPASALASMK